MVHYFYCAVTPGRPPAGTHLPRAVPRSNIGPEQQSLALAPALAPALVLTQLSLHPHAPQHPLICYTCMSLSVLGLLLQFLGSNCGTSLAPPKIHDPEFDRPLPTVDGKSVPPLSCSAAPELRMFLCVSGPPPQRRHFSSAFSRWLLQAQLRFAPVLPCGVSFIFV